MKSKFDALRRAIVQEGPRQTWQRVTHRALEPFRQRARETWRDTHRGMRTRPEAVLRSLGAPGGPVDDGFRSLEQRLRTRWARGVASGSAAQILQREHPAWVRATLEEAGRLLEFDARSRCPWLPAAQRGPAARPDWPWHAAFGLNRAPAPAWPLLPSDELEGICDAEGADVRLTWELNRCQFVVCLAQAWAITGNVQYARAVVDAISSWIRQNPLLMGVNWLHAQETALRMKAWMWAWALVSDCPAILPTERRAVFTSLLEHAEYTRLHLSRSPNTHNHLLTEACALAGFATVFADSPRWAETAAWANAIVDREIQKQLWEDGFPAEGSPSYLAFVAESLAEWAAQRTHWGTPLPEASAQRLARMAEVMLVLARQDGTMPRLADVDDGRGFVLSQVDQGRDRRAAAVVLAELFHADIPTPVPALEAPLWLLGEPSRRPAAPPRSAPSSPVRLYPRGGVAVLRADDGAPHRRTHLVVSAGATAHRPGVSTSHHHADALSLCWWQGGEDWLVDPATAVYNGPRRWRTALRQANAHSSLQLNDLDPLDVSTWRFAVKGEPRSEILDWHTDAALVRASFRLWLPLLVSSDEAGRDSRNTTTAELTRSLLWSRRDRWLVVTDEVNTHSVPSGAAATPAAERRIARQWFQLGRGEVELDGGACARVTHSADGGGFRLHFAFSSQPGSLHLNHAKAEEPGPGTFSRRYGLAEPGCALERRTELAGSEWRSVWALIPDALGVSTVSWTRTERAETLDLIGQGGPRTRVVFAVGKPRAES